MAQQWTWNLPGPDQGPKGPQERLTLNTITQTKQTEHGTEPGIRDQRPEGQMPNINGDQGTGEPQDMGQGK